MHWLSNSHIDIICCQIPVVFAGSSISMSGVHLVDGVEGPIFDIVLWFRRVIKHIKSGDILDDTVKWSKFSNAEWAKDNSGFYYSRYSKPQKGDEYKEVNRNQKLFFHTLGQPQSNDQLIYERSEERRVGKECRSRWSPSH